MLQYSYRIKNNSAEILAVNTMALQNTANNIQFKKSLLSK
jgi:hypothetical protein